MKRVVAGVDGGVTPYTPKAAAARCTLGGRDLHATCNSLHQLIGAGYRNILYLIYRDRGDGGGQRFSPHLIYRDRGDGGGQRFSPLRTVPGDHNFGELLQVLGELNVQDSLVCEGDILCNISDVTEPKNQLSVRNMEFVVTVDIGNGTRRCAQNGHVYTCKPGAVLTIRDGSGEQSELFTFGLCPG